jgi:lauroyl/myristoyl acyltransferase
MPTTAIEDPPVADYTEAERPVAGERPIPVVVRARIAFVRFFLITYARALGLSGLYRLGRFFGFLEYLCDYKRRRRATRKLVELFGDELPPAVRRRHVIRYFMRLRCDKMFYTIMDRIPRAKLLNRIKLKNREFIDGPLAGGNGLYVALSHYGAHHVAGLMMALLGYKLAGVRDARESHVRRYIQDKYRQTFPEVAAIKILMATSFPRQILRHFKEGNLVASLLDVDRRRGETTRMQTVQFFGKQREFLTGPVQIALRCGAPMIQGFIVSRPNFYYQLIPSPPLIDPADAAQLDEDEVLRRVMDRYALGVEQFVRRHPDHIVNI